MHVRDAREADAMALSAIADVPRDVLGTLIHDRTVRVAEAEPSSGSVDTDRSRYDGSDAENILGFVSFDAREDVVTVTQLDGTRAACHRLLEEPIDFAATESMAVEALVTVDQDCFTEALERRGFSATDGGPRFDGDETVLFRLEP